MNVVGDRAFNMYLNSENEKLSRPPLNRDQIALAIMRKVSFFNSYKCFCSGFNSETTSPLFEEKHVTEILMSSLNISVAEHILSLTQNYTVEELALSELSLKAFFAFVANTPKFAAEKARILTALNEQLRLHPSCSSYMVSRYRDLMLLRDEEFAGLSLLEFVVTKLEQLVSVNNDVQISSTRSSRRRRRPTRMVDESPIKRPKRVEVFVDSDEDETNGSEADPSSKGQHPDVENLLRLLEHLVNILRHDVGYMLKCGEKVHTCILGQLMFGADGMPNQSFVTRICEVLKNAETLPVLRGISELLDLVGDVCALQQTDSDPNGGYDVELPGPCRSLINEICATVIGEKPSPAKAFSVVVNLGPAWLRYYTIRYLIEKIFCRKVPFGLKGVVSVFNSIHRNIRERVMDTTKVLKLVNHNQLAYAGICKIFSKFLFSMIKLLFWKWFNDWAGGGGMKMTVVHVY